MPTRMYLVELSRKKVLVESTSQEAAVRIATKPMVKKVTIPSPLEVARMMREGVETIAPSLAPAPAPVEAAQEPAMLADSGVGDLGLRDGEGAGESGE